MKIFVKKIVLLFVLTAIIFFSFFFWLISHEPIFSTSYTASIFDKYERLCEINEPKIVLIAGSNFAFGINSQIIQEAFHMPVVNLGLQASWGMNPMLNITKDHINEGDIIILGFEYHLYNSPDANYELIVNTLESNINFYRQIVDINNIFPLTASYVQYFCNNFYDITNENTHSYVGPYSRDSFNEYGDNNYDRPQFIAENIPTRYLSVNEKNVSTDAITYLNDYAEFVQDNKAHVYITFASTNELVFAPDSNIDAFIQHIEKYVNIPIISNPYEYIYPCDYFFDGDGNHHLNNNAIQIRTQQLINDIRKVLT